MSASINWQPIGERWHRAGSGSAVVEALRESFCDGNEWILGESNLERLRGMFAATKDDTYLELIEAIERCGDIRVSATY